MIQSLVNFYPCLDIEQTTSFYLDVIGLKLHQDQGTARIFDTGYGYLGFCEYDDHILATKTCISFNLSSKEEVDHYYHLMKEKQVKILSEPSLHDKYQVYSFFIEDVNGYKVEFQKIG